MQSAMTAKKPGNTGFSGRFRTKRTYTGRIKDDHKIEAAGGSGKLPGIQKEINE